MAMDVRECLISHFHSSRRSVADCYAESYLDIAAAMTAAGDDGARERAMSFFDRLGMVFDGDDFDERVKQRSSRLQSAPGFLSKIRRRVSRLLPLPRIRG